MNTRIVRVNCPYCGLRRKISHDESAYLPTYNCDPDDGGCDSMFALRVRVEIHATALKIEGEGSLESLKRFQSRICEFCPPGDTSVNAGEHSDDCLRLQEAIEKAEGGV